MSRSTLVQVSGLILGTLACLAAAVVFSVTPPDSANGAAVPGLAKDMGLVFLGMGAGANCALVVVYPRLRRRREA